MSSWLIPIVIITATYALFQAANNTAVITDVSPDERGVISGMLNVSRNLGLITGASVMGAVFALGSRAGDFTTAHPEAVAIGMRVAFAVATVLVFVALVIAHGSMALLQPAHRYNREREDCDGTERLCAHRGLQSHAARLARARFDRIFRGRVTS